VVAVRMHEPSPSIPRALCRGVYDVGRPLARRDEFLMRARGGTTLRVCRRAMPRCRCRARQQQKDKAEERSQSIFAIGATVLVTFPQGKATTRTSRMAKMLRAYETTITRVKTAHAREQVREECQRSSC